MLFICIKEQFKVSINERNYILEKKKSHQWKNEDRQA